MEFRGFLKDLQDWDSLHKDNSIKSKGRADKAAKPTKGNFNGDKEPISKFSTVHARKNNAKEVSSSEKGELFNYLKNSHAFDQASNRFLNEEKLPDATSEKELGNEYFKQKKFPEAIECYSRSIAFTPTSVAFANRAMAYLKLKKFEEAENDCTEALNLDDHYVKAYSRRATSRKEQMKLEEAMEDAEFAVRLEPNNPETRKQYAEIKEMLGRKFIQNPSGQKISDAASKESKVKGICSVTGENQITEASAVQTMDYEDNISVHPVISIKNVDKGSTSSITERFNNPCSLNGPGENATSRLNTSYAKDLASRAVSHVMATAPKNIARPTSAYQFEVSWRSLSNDSGKQTQMLKTIPPADLPKIFKNALSAPLLIDIIRCIATFFEDDTTLAVSMIDYLTKVPRFDMIIMCLSTVERVELHRLWEEVFSTDPIEGDLKQILSRLRPKYDFGQ